MWLLGSLASLLAMFQYLSHSELIGVWLLGSLASLLTIFQYFSHSELIGVRRTLGYINWILLFATFT